MVTRNLSAGDAAYAKLRKDIVRSVLAPGERFSEETLVGRYGFGKAAVRAALLRLRHDGLVERAPRRAHQVTLLTQADRAELNAMRVLLEPEAARLAAQRRTEAQAARIEHLAGESARDQVKSRPAKFLSVNQSFHLAVANASGNRRLAASIEALMAEGERVLGALLRLKPVAWHFGDNNIQVAEAIVRQEPDRAAELMHDLVLGGVEFFSEAFESTPV